jgi:hypothetical protein
MLRVAKFSPVFSSISHCAEQIKNFKSDPRNGKERKGRMRPRNREKRGGEKGREGRRGRRKRSIAWYTCFDYKVTTKCHSFENCDLVISGSGSMFHFINCSTSVNVYGRCQRMISKVKAEQTFRNWQPLLPNNYVSRASLPSPRRNKKPPDTVIPIFHHLIIQHQVSR